MIKLQMIELQVIKLKVIKLKMMLHLCWESRAVILTISGVITVYEFISELQSIFLLTPKDMNATDFSRGRYILPIQSPTSTLDMHNVDCGSHRLVPF